MTVERTLRSIAGFFITASLLFAYFHSLYWVLFTGFVGLNLFQSEFTDWCPMLWLLRKLGLLGLIEMMTFLLVLVVAFVYVWKKGALIWE